MFCNQSSLVRLDSLTMKGHEQFSIVSWKLGEEWEARNILIQWKILQRFRAEKDQIPIYKRTRTMQKFLFEWKKTLSFMRSWWYKNMRNIQFSMTKSLQNHISRIVTWINPQLTVLSQSSWRFMTCRNFFFAIRVAVPYCRNFFLLCENRKCFFLAFTLAVSLINFLAHEKKQ